MFGPTPTTALNGLVVSALVQLMRKVPWIPLPENSQVWARVAAAFLSLTGAYLSAYIAGPEALGTFDGGVHLGVIAEAAWTLIGASVGHFFLLRDASQPVATNPEDKPGF